MMKKYIAPVVRVVEFDTESTLLANSINDEVGLSGHELSNKRESASNSIWGFDDEAQ